MRPFTGPPPLSCLTNRLSSCSSEARLSTPTGLSHANPTRQARFSFRPGSWPRPFPARRTWSTSVCVVTNNGRVRRLLFQRPAFFDARLIARSRTTFDSQLVKMLNLFFCELVKVLNQTQNGQGCQITVPNVCHPRKLIIQRKLAEILLSHHFVVQVLNFDSKEEPALFFLNKQSFSSTRLFFQPRRYAPAACHNVSTCDNINAVRPHQRETKSSLDEYNA
jgi:hypothetical protein